jgi:hypothetical protein
MWSQVSMPAQAAADPPSRARFWSLPQPLEIRVMSASRPGRFHNVTCAQGAWHCDCEGFTHHQKCWAVTRCRQWLESILPAGDLPWRPLTGVSRLSLLAGVEALEADDDGCGAVRWMRQAG